MMQTQPGSREMIEKVRALTGGGKKFFLQTYGCQQNESDSEKLTGMLYLMGYTPCERMEDADFVLYNTCAVRENAELRVYGNVGALVHLKRRKPDMLIAVCGCMAQQAHVVTALKEKYRHVDLIFGPHALAQFPALVYQALMDRKVVINTDESLDQGVFAEHLPITRSGKYKALVTIMRGCDNFCSYCVVPYVRGRQVSRAPEQVLAEVRQLIDKGYKDITLLGQNVNSYGQDLGLALDFADLLEMICQIEGDFIVRFMTSHPKDASSKLIDAMAKHPKIAKQLHLPFQAGNAQVLAVMNRRYTPEKYLSLIDYAREKMPDIVLTSDVIVGFPGESDEQFMDTIRLVERVRFDSLFTFLYSKREHTPASQMPDQVPEQEKKRRFNLLIETQNRISLEKNQQMLGKHYRILCEGASKNDPDTLSGRTEGGKIVNFKGDNRLIGQFVEVEITQARTWSFIGKALT